MTAAYNAAAVLSDQHLLAGDGDRVALRCRGDQWTYADVARDVWRAQNAITTLGIDADSSVAMIVDDEPGFPAWFLACLRAGVPAVPISTMLTPDDQAALVDDAGAAVVVFSERHAARAAAIARAGSPVKHVVVLGDVEPAAGITAAVHAWTGFDDAREPPVAPTSGDSPGFWLYSSGTTGTPKGVVHRHASLAATAEAFGRRVLAIDRDDRFLSVAKLFFAYGLGNSLTFPFSVGATSVLNPDPPTPENMISLLQRERPTLFFTTPGFTAALLDAGIPGEALASIRLTVSAGEALPADLHRSFRERSGRPVLDGIGSTEALNMFCSNRPDDERPGTSGTPVPGWELRLLDDAGADVTEPNVPGALHVRGPSLTLGYWRRPDATAAALQNGWLRTGDVYTRTEDGAWRFLGRDNDMIKAGGIWVSPAEVESAIVEHPDVLEVAVVGGHDVNDLETVVAFVVPRQGHSIDPASIEQQCRDRLASFKRPRRIEVVDDLPRTATGKIRRFELRARLDAERATR